MSKTILITGSNGFIGKSLRKQLIELGYIMADFNTSDGDIAKANLQFKNIDHIFHLAAKSFVPESWENPAAFYDVNVTGTLNILEFCRKTKANLTFISSYVYGTPMHLPIDEMHPVKALNPYAHSKILAESLCLFYQDNFNVNSTIIRPFNIFGVNQNLQFLIPKILSQLFDKSCPKIELMDLKPKRDYLYMDDFINAMIMLFEKNKTGIYNIGSGYSISVEDVVNKIMHVTGIKKEYSSINAVRKNEIMDVVADISKIKIQTGWSPEFSFEQGISEIIKQHHLIK